MRTKLAKRTASLLLASVLAASLIPTAAFASGSELSQRYGNVMSGMAAGYSASPDYWQVLAMEAYSGTDTADADYASYRDAQGSSIMYVFSEAARGNLFTSKMEEFTGYDVTQSYAEYTCPNILMAYDVCGADDSTYAVKRDDLVSSMTAYLSDLDAHGATADSVGPMLCGLSKYYNAASYSGSLGITSDNYDAIKTAVDAAVQWLSDEQNANGTWSDLGWGAVPPTPNANSTAMAIIGLAAVGVDAHTDADFIKGNSSGIEGLLTYALSDFTGFGYTDNTVLNAYSSKQAFAALAAYARFKNTGSAYNIFTDAANGSASAVPAPDISATYIPATDDNDGPAVSKPSAAAPKNPYSDVSEGAWYYDAAIYCADAGIITEMSLGSFAPDDYMTRAVLVTALYRIAGEPTIYFIKAPDAPFSDVEDGTWCFDAVLWAATEGITDGTGDGKFMPDEPVTREQFAAMLYRFAKYKGYDTTQGGMAIREFDDFESVSDYALEAVAWTVNTGIVRGRDGMLAPRSDTSRAEGAQMLARFCKL